MRKQKWEYRVLIVNQEPGSQIQEMSCELGHQDYGLRGPYEELAQLLDRAGFDSWEVCGTISQTKDSLILLKRPHHRSS